jgi:HEPN domain-containing protein
MIDIQKQIYYWIDGAENDIVTAEILIRERRSLHGWFFCHLVIEKALKAHYVKVFGEVATRSHNLNYLSEKTGLELDDATQIFLGILMKYQLQGCYPDYSPVIPEQIRVNEYFNKTKDLLQWLKGKL